MIGAPSSEQLSSEAIPALKHGQIAQHDQSKSRLSFLARALLQLCVLQLGVLTSEGKVCEPNKLGSLAMVIVLASGRELATQHSQEDY